MIKKCLMILLLIFFSQTLFSIDNDFDVLEVQYSQRYPSHTVIIHDQCYDKNLKNVLNEIQVYKNSQKINASFDDCLLSTGKILNSPLLNGPLLMHDIIVFNQLFCALKGTKSGSYVDKEYKKFKKDYCAYTQKHMKWSLYASAACVVGACISKKTDHKIMLFTCLVSSCVLFIYNRMISNKYAMVCQLGNENVTKKDIFIEEYMQIGRVMPWRGPKSSTESVY